MKKKPGRSRGPVAVASALLVGLLISGFTVWSASEAAFTATTENTGNRWHTGQITLGDNDDEATAMFTSLAKQYPGVPMTRCIDIDYAGNWTAGAPVKLYGATATRTALLATPGLSQYVDLTIEVGDYSSAPGSNDFSCTNFVATGTIWGPVTNGTLYTFQTTRYDWSTGLGTGWTPATGEHKGFRFTTEIRSNNSAQNLDLTGIPFTWEVQR